MDLRDYLRPKDDTGIGVHWSAGFPAAIGLGQIRDVWLPELRAMGVKWVKLARHDGGLELSELLLENDMMPVVRLYRFQPNPGILDEAALRWVKDYVAAGVRYFEFNNEPDLGVEWQGGVVPPDALEIVVRNAIVDIEAVLDAGGYPGIPALTVGSKWDLVGEICRQGRRDLFAEPVWQALHNYSLNHPLDYPYDAGNQSGASYTQDFYDRLAAEPWEGVTWGGWSVDRVNQERQAHANPGATAFDDPSCWRAYERYDKLIRDQIGRSLPILATENGYIVGERPDPRYPATTPQLHAAQTLEACRIMMGTSSRFDHAPDYYFCTAFWLLGNYALGSWSPDWEGQAWYSTRWSGNRLPVVEALKTEPKQARSWRGDAGLAGRVSGQVEGGAGLDVRLERDDGWALTVRVGEDERYEFTDVPLASYRVLVVNTNRSRKVTLTQKRPAATARFDVTGVTITSEASTVRGVVRGGAGQTVHLSRGNDWSQEQVAAPDGSYRFTGLAAGTYALALPGAGVVQSGIQLDGRNEVAVDLVAPGWGWELTDGGASPGFGVIRCRVTGRSDLDVHLWADGWEGTVLRTGSKSEYGADVCEFAPLGVGRYQLQPDRLEAVAVVTVDGRRVNWVTFTERTSQAPRKGVVAGRVRNGDGCTIRLLRPPASEPVAEIRAAADGAYRFEKLSAGIYTVQAAASGPSAATAERSDVIVDGASQVQVDLELPPAETAEMRWSVQDGGEAPGFSVIRCSVAGGAGRPVSLWTYGWGGLTQLAGSKPEYGPDACEFAPLGPGTYFVELKGLPGSGVPQSVRAEVNLPPNRAMWVYFEGGEPDTRGPESPEKQPAPVSSRTSSVIVGNVKDGEGLLVLLSGPAGTLQATVTEGRYQFEDLSAGVYRVAILSGDSALGEIAVTEGLEADGDNLITVDFDLSEPATRAQSHISGRVRGGALRTIVLEGPLRKDSEQKPESFVTAIAGDEIYMFDGLAAGTYRATVLDTDPPTGSTQTQAGIELDGINSAQVDFDLNALGPGKTLDHYLLTGGVARTKEDFLTTLRYVARFHPTVGVEEAEARRARHVTILGGVGVVSALVEQGLRMSGCYVQRIEADFAENLGRLLDENRPY